MFISRTSVTAGDYMPYYKLIPLWQKGFLFLKIFHCNKENYIGLVGNHKPGFNIPNIFFQFMCSNHNRIISIEDKF